MCLERKENANEWKLDLYIKILKNWHFKIGLVLL